MNLITLIFQLILTIPLTIILQYFNNKENRLINHILIPSIYIIIISALIPSISTNIFLIVIFEIFIRNFYITNITNQDKEVSTFSFIIESLISIALSLFTYNYFISKVDTVIPNPEDIKGFVWFLIVLYVVNLYNSSTKDKVKKDSIKKSKLKSERVIMQYAKLKNTYFNIIKSKNNVINNLIYAIMINEETKNPKVYRQFKETFNAILRKETYYGIMQEKSYNRVSDEDSVKLAVERFEKILRNTDLKEKEQIDKILINYSVEDKENIINIYNIITNFLKR